MPYFPPLIDEGIDVTANEGEVMIIRQEEVIGRGSLVIREARSGGNCGGD